MFKKFTKKFYQYQWCWKTTITSKGMIRVCWVTGKKEFLDGKNNTWIPFKNEEELVKLREKLLYANLNPISMTQNKHPA